MASLELQIARLNDMKSILDEFAGLLETQMKEVESMLDDLIRMSFPEEIADKYRYNYLNEDKAIVEDLAVNIRTDQFDYIDNKIRGFLDTGNVD